MFDSVAYLCSHGISECISTICHILSSGKWSRLVIATWFGQMQCYPDTDVIMHPISQLHDARILWVDKESGFRRQKLILRQLAWRIFHSTNSRVDFAKMTRSLSNGFKSISRTTTLHTTGVITLVPFQLGVNVLWVFSGYQPRQRH